MPTQVRLLFPEAEAALAEFHGILATDGLTRGVIGPREVSRLWDRHLLNCAVVTERVPAGAATLADVGSGAGLPGVVLAIVRPELQVTLVEPLERRSQFLAEVVQRLELGARVHVVRARAEELTGQAFDCVTARAVAPLERLVGWCLPLTRPGAPLLAIKGARAGEEVARARAIIRPIPAMTIVVCGEGIVSPPTTVVEVRVAGSVASADARPSGGEES